jgi:hypothetical protein
MPNETDLAVLRGEIQKLMSTATELNAEEKARREREDDTRSDARCKSDDEFWERNAQMVEEERAREKAEIERAFKPTPIRSIKNKVARFILAGFFRTLKKNEAKIKALQEKYGSVSIPRIFLFRFKDEHIGIMFKIQNGEVVVLTQESPHIIITTDLAVFCDIRRGYIDQKEQDGTITRQEYNCIDAWRRGELVIDTTLAPDGDEGWLSYMLLFDDILKEFREDIADDSDEDDDLEGDGDDR